MKKSLKEVTSTKPASPPRSPSKERKEEEEEEGGAIDRTSSEGLNKEERMKEQMEVGEEKVGEKEDEVSIDQFSKPQEQDFQLYCTIPPQDQLSLSPSISDQPMTMPSPFND